MLTSEKSVLWALVDSMPDAVRSEQEMIGPLLARLSTLPIPRLARFQRELLDCLDGLLSWRLWEAADVIHELPCSGDTFADFRLWVVAQGGEVYREVLRDADSLASIPEIGRIIRLPLPWADADYPHFGSLGALAGDAFDEILAKLGPAVAASVERPAVLDEQIPADLTEPFPEDYGADAAVHLRLPMLSALRGWSL
ncbi:DUF4240 domain-containing protein [Actinoplanes sp. NPDC051411]|jgi:hypothetical protein|uniref:DUF4240 domain-containing protein n=1 Tax=Actinoplanes sp. NPDC051411 TaxID=3155522 RepID=UPI0034468374